MLSLLIAQVALGADQADASTSGAIRALAQQPLGRLLVILIGIGMLLLALWQVLVAVSRNEGARETASSQKSRVVRRTGLRMGRGFVPRRVSSTGSRASATWRLPYSLGWLRSRQQQRRPTIVSWMFGT